MTNAVNLCCFKDPEAIIFRFYFHLSGRERTDDLTINNTTVFQINNIPLPLLRKRDTYRKQ